MHTEDGYIIQECLNGDETAFTFLVDKYKKSVYSLAYARLHNFHDAQDVTQEVFIRAYKSLQTLKRWDNFMGWLYRITINVCKTWLKLKDRQPDSDFVEDQDASLLNRNSMTSYREKITHESIQEALESLPEMYREVLTLRYFGGMNIKEISIFIGTSPRTVDRRLKEALTQLKEETLAIIGTAKEQHDLPAAFTFRIAEIVKHIKIHPVSTMKGLPWGLSLATGIIITVLSLNPSLNPVATLGSIGGSLLPSESKVPKVGEIPVDITKVSKLSFISNQQGTGNSSEPSFSQNALFMAPKANIGEWVRKADMPTPRGQLTTAAVNGKIYAIGGLIDLNYHVTATVEEYDPINDVWTKKADLPKPKMTNYSASVVDGIIYMVGGADYDKVGNTVDAYDPIKDKWTSKKDMPTPRKNFCTEVANGKIYAMGGIGAGTANFGKNISAVEEYDPVNDTWTKKADMPGPRDVFCCATFDNKIYVFGGQIWYGNWGDPIVPETLEYDPIVDRWTQKSNMPTPRAGAGAVLVDNKIYVIGGFGAKGLPDVPIVEIYDPSNDTWSKGTDMLTAKEYPCCNLIDGKIYVIGGFNCNIGIMILSSVEEYDTGFSSSSIIPKGKLSKTWESKKR
jgi:RNA polymerase sigma factor (sigma-70 family)